MIHSKKIFLLGVLTLFFGLILVTTTQDILAALLLDRGFYLSESLLFKLIWLLFIPMTAGLWLGGKRAGRTKWPLWLWFGAALLLSVWHLFLSASLIVLVAQRVLDLPFTFLAILKYLIVHQGALVLLLYAVLFGLFYYRPPSTKTRATPLKVDMDYPKILSIRQGKKLIPVPVDQIQYIQSAAPYISIAIEGKKYLSNHSLKSILETLDPGIFVRIHRTTIVNTHSIKELHSRLNGDYDVILQDGTTLRWSRNYHTHLKRVLALH